MKTETSGVGEHQKEAQRTYLLTVGLKEGRGLVIRDRCGECINTTHPETLHTTYIWITITGFGISAYLHLHLCI